MEKAITPVIEHHPWGFFLPENTHLLMLGSFPPPRIRWSMDFYYPNIQNDMWRILGLLFYADKDYFLATPKNFSEEKCRAFCNQIGLGLGDTGMEVIRQKGNASDKFLEVIKPMNLDTVLTSVPLCQALVVTGQKAMDTLLAVIREHTSLKEPDVGSFESFTYSSRTLKLYRMPSSSRAYPKPLVEKAAIYQRMFEQIGLLPRGKE